LLRGIFSPPAKGGMVTSGSGRGEPKQPAPPSVGWAGQSGENNNRADAVIISVTFVSLSALHRVRQACKRIDKPYYQLRQTGLAAIATTLADCTRAM
jgi:hypothetical protein